MLAAVNIAVRAVARVGNAVKTCTANLTAYIIPLPYIQVNKTNHEFYNISIVSFLKTWYNKHSKLLRRIPMAETLIEKYIIENGEYIAIPVGTSMYPMLRNRRDSVHLVRYDMQGLKKYDLPVYKRIDGSQIMHRCLGKDENGYIMCGDNQWTLEHGIKEEQIIAVAKGFYRDEKYIPNSNIIYRLYCRIWCLSLRLRKQALRVIHKINPRSKIMENYKKI